MENTTRDDILFRLKCAPRTVLEERPERPVMAEEAMDTEQLIDRFRGLFEAQTGVFLRAVGNDGVLEKLGPVLEAEGVVHAVATTDDVLAELDLPAWGGKAGFDITTHKDYANREAFKRAVFEDVQAGITGADFAFAESGTLCLLINDDMPRLTSLAPIVHVAILPVERLVPTYEHMARKMFAKGAPPTQVVFITGPSMTADIQATPFKGMHGPRRVVVVLKE
ncbi:MAG: lactate utilization protein C [Desulfatibacillaceae bacterium]